MSYKTIFLPKMSPLGVFCCCTSHKEKRFFCICFHLLCTLVCACLLISQVFYFIAPVSWFSNLVTIAHFAFYRFCILFALEGTWCIHIIMFQKNCPSLICSWKGKGPAPIHSLPIQSHLCQPLHYLVAFFQITPEAFSRNSLDFSSSCAINGLKPHAFSYSVMDHAFNL